MSDRILHDEYLRRVAEAEAALVLTTDRAARDSWERIIVGYLELADQLERKRGKPAPVRP